MKDNAPGTWAVVVNHARRQALMPADLPVPPGWTATGFTGTEQECVEHVDALASAAGAQR